MAWNPIKYGLMNGPNVSNEDTLGKPNDVPPDLLHKKTYTFEQTRLPYVQAPDGFPPV
jgi:hypothetical protein